MAIGLLGTGTTTGSSPVTVYTVPSGISHAVVHITLSSNNNNRTASVDSTVILRTNNGGSGSDMWNVSTSMMLSPENVITVEGGTDASCTVSGYEVPL
jgi:hypothetical protein